jgi:hypothetical protein
MKTKYVPRKNGRGVWCYAERMDRKSCHHSKHNKHKKNNQKQTIGIYINNTVVLSSSIELNRIELITLTEPRM